MDKKQIIKYLESNELDVQSANATIWTADLVYEAYVNSQNDPKGTPKNNLNILFCNINFRNPETPFQMPWHTQIAAKRGFAGMEKRVYEDCLKDKKSIVRKIKKHQGLEYKLDGIWKNYKKIRKNITKKEELKTFQKMIPLYKDWWHYAVIGENKGDFITSDIVPAFAKRHALEISQANEIFNSLSHPKEQSVLSLERKKFLEICLLYNRRADNALAKRIDNYLKKYFWFKTDIYRAREMTPALVAKEVVKEVNKRGKEEIKKEFLEIDKNFNSLEKNKKELMKTMKFNKRDKIDIYFAEQIKLWADIRKEGMMKGMYYLYTFIEDSAKRRNLQYPDLSAYLLKDIENFIKNDVSPDKQVLKEREKGIFLYWQRGKKVKFFLGQDAKDLLKAATEIKTNEVKGQIASSGGLKKVEGRVKIIYNPAKEKFEHGEILVASMTRVEFVPLMRKAKAIITNEGGIACHAAIVSRELGLPCIIGTKNATRVLKDGDQVEMDLDRGTVKIMSRK
ncbi:MAG: PEP-utilizing enzyme [Candidatus Staskawiczbacteria bacterium]|jgi:phosphoenolpyruvate synthase/pyruvate phosphate dikinase